MPIKLIMIFILNMGNSQAVAYLYCTGCGIHILFNRLCGYVTTDYLCTIRKIFMYDALRVLLQGGVYST